MLSSFIIVVLTYNLIGLIFALSLHKSNLLDVCHLSLLSIDGSTMRDFFLFTNDITNGLSKSLGDKMLSSGAIWNPFSGLGTFVFCASACGVVLLDSIPLGLRELAPDAVRLLAMLLVGDFTFISLLAFVIYFKVVLLSSC